jgi:hypothetical protein
MFDGSTSTSTSTASVEFAFSCHEIRGRLSFRILTDKEASTGDDDDDVDARQEGAMVEQLFLPLNNDNDNDALAAFNFNVSASAAATAACRFGRDDWRECASTCPSSSTSTTSTSATTSLCSAGAQRLRFLLLAAGRVLARRVFELHRGEQNKRLIAQQKGLLHTQR